MFNNESDPGRIYSFTARAPVEGLALVDEQMNLAHRFQNEIVALEQKRRQEVEQHVRSNFPDMENIRLHFEDLDQRFTVALEELTQQNYTVRKKMPKSPLAVLVRTLRKERAEAARIYRERKKEVWSIPSFRIILDEIDSRYEESYDKLYEKYGEPPQDCSRAALLCWGSRLAVQAAMKGRHKGPPPKFKVFRGHGRLVLQLQHGRTMEQILSGNDTNFRIERVSPPTHNKKGQPLPLADPNSNRSKKRKWCLAWIRLGSTGKGNRIPLWCKVPFFLDHEVPEGSLVKWVYLRRHRVGETDTWRVQLVLTREEGWEKPNQAQSGVAGLDVGWRLMEDRSLRVAYLVGEDGQKDQLLMPPRMVTGWNRVETLQSTRDTMFTDIKEILDGWLKNHEVPEWLAEKSAFLLQWRSQNRLADLVLYWLGNQKRQWQSRRFPGDEEILKTLETWRKQDRHLLSWQENQRKKNLDSRDNLFWDFANKVRKQYQTVVIENINWARFKEKPNTEDGWRGGQEHRDKAAVGRLLELIKQSVTFVSRQSARNTTVTCFKCGYLEKDFDASANLIFTCSDCGCRIDQDENACMNLLASYKINLVNS